MQKVRTFALSALTLTLAACGQQSAPNSTLGSTNLSAQAAGGQVYLVGFKPGQGANTAAIAKVGGQLRKTFKTIGAASATLTAVQAKKLAADTSVEYVEPARIRSIARYVAEDRNVNGTTLGTPQGPLGNLGVDWQPQGEYTYGDVALQVPTLKASGYTGTGIAVCVADTGIDGNHPEFAGKLKGYKNFMGDGRDNAYALNDVSHHGTHVAGTIFAQYGAGTAGSARLDGMDASGVGGTAPGVNLYMARVLGDDGYSTDESVTEGVNWCVSQLKSQGGTEDRVIISLSLGGSDSSTTEKRAYQAAYDAGALTIAAAGNDGNKLPHYPSDYPSVVKVGAIDHLGNLANFSNYNSKQELVAPGVDVLSSVPVGQGTNARASAQGVPAYASVMAATYTAQGTVSNTPIVAAGGAGNTFCGVGISNPALSGKIALISRGSCTFGEKVDNAVRSGALAVIVYNNTSGTLGMTLGSQKTVPVVGITQADGLATLAAVQSNPTVLGSVSVTPSDYEYYNGTSMATPHVSAAAALVWSAKKGLTNAELRALLSATATDLGINGRDNFFGNGLVNPKAAIEAAGKK